MKTTLRISARKVEIITEPTGCKCGSANEKKGENSMKVNWYPYPETRPGKSGDYLTVYSYEDDGKDANIDVTPFLEEGDTLFYGEPEAGDTPEEKMLDQAMNREIKCGKSGFYNIPLDGMPWMVKPKFWAFLPELPEGYTYAVEEE